MENLTPEEQFIWNCARYWRKPAPALLTGPLDWLRVAQIGRINRMETLLRDLLIRLDAWDGLPPDARTILQEGADKYARNAAVMGESLHTYLHMAAERGIDTAVLKGLSISINLYGNPAMRPGGDIDILVREKDVTASLDILEEMGIGQNWPNLMRDDYYTRHHLHQQRCTEDLTLWYEIHWALDHPLTRLTIDYEGMMDRAAPGALLDAPVYDLAWEDNLIALCVHLVKHAVYLTAVLDRPDLPRILLADGMLLYFLDAAELVNLHGANLDWRQLVACCRAFGAAEMVGAVLQVCARYLAAAVPDPVLAELPVAPPGRLKRRIMRRVAEYETAAYLGQRQSRLWHFLLVTNGAFILRPIRLLDLSEYLFPGRDFLQRKYGDSGRRTAVKHTIRALGQYGRAAKDTLYFTWERYRRLRRQNYAASLFNRLEVEA